MEHDLQQQIAKLVAQIVEIVTGDGIGDLIGLLERVRRDGREILLEVPPDIRSPACAPRP
jgi:hypothetical protein